MATCNVVVPYTYAFPAATVAQQQHSDCLQGRQYYTITAENAHHYAQEITHAPFMWRDTHRHTITALVAPKATAVAKWVGA
jgi:hypothetical protein